MKTKRNFKPFLKKITPEVIKKVYRTFVNKPINSIKPPQPNNGESYTNYKHLSDLKLYSDNEYCLNYLKTSMYDCKEPSNLGIIFHAYWIGMIGEKQIFSINSVLATQKAAKVILWIDKKSWNLNKKNNLLENMRGKIEIVCYDVFKEIKGTPFETLDRLHFSQYSDLPLRADVFRIIILSKYSGVYFDLDIFFLRDISNLCKNDFIYCWERQPYGNSAVLHLKSSNLIENIALSIKEINTFIPWILFNYANKNLKDLFVYPVTFFDPVWRITNEKGYLYPIKSFSEFFNNSSNLSTYRDFFPGVYAYHWHNQWNVKPVQYSYFDIFQKELTILLNSRI